MSLRLYMDVHVRRSISGALRQRRVDIITAQEDESTRLLDPALLDRALALGRVLFSQDADLLREAALRQRRGIDFLGVIFAHQQDLTDRECIEDLELLAKAYNPEDIHNRVVYLPIR